MNNNAKKKVLLVEKFVKGQEINYWVNPNALELIKIWRSSTYKSLRFLYDKTNTILYVWRAEDGLHKTFVKKEIPEKPYYMFGGEPNSARLDTTSADSTTIGINLYNDKNFMKKMTKLFKTIEKELGFTYEEDRIITGIGGKLVSYKQVFSKNDR